VREKKRNKINAIIFFTIILICYISQEPVVNTPFQAFFTLRTINNGGYAIDYFYEISQQLDKIGISLDNVVLDWSNFVNQLITAHNFDLVFLGLSGDWIDPDFTGIYDENGPLNLFGYDISMDYNESLGTGLNEWYMQQGRLMMPPNSQERIQHYWAWEQYLMDKICPLLPLLNYNNYIAYWSNLEGYNQSKGIIQSWGDIVWDNLHLGQNNTEEIVIQDASWSNLNPIFREDSASSFISKAILDPLVWIDSDMSIWPHLAKTYTYLNDTTIEIKTREGLKWDTDSEGNFTNEHFDVRDVYFTLYCWKEVSNDPYMYDWIKDMKITDDQTMILYVDENNTTTENEPYAPSLASLSLLILPEHYLNQTQLPDGKTPDITHIAWSIFETHPFGTSLFKFKNYTTGLETILTVRPDSWILNNSITNDPSLNWSTRFGDFSEVINQLRIRIITDIQTAKNEFLNGYLDILSLNNLPETREQLYNDTNFSIQSIPQFSMNFIGFNMRENRNPLGSRELCPNDKNMTKGLAIRKAICYAIDRVKINEQIHHDDYRIIYWPIPERLGIWCNPSIIHYDYNLLKAYEMMEKAGYDIPGFYLPGTGTNISIGNKIISCELFFAIFISLNFMKKKRKKNAYKKL